MPSQATSIVAALSRKTAKACKALILEIDANLREATPVDTGHARANWVPSIGAPAVGEGGESAHAAGVAALLAYKLDQGDLFVTNNVPYIQQLDLGSSKQAPVGFVEVALDQAQATINSKYATQFNISTQGAGTFSDDAGGYAAENMASYYSPFGDE